MDMITDMLTTLGSHFSLVVIGSVEVLAAVVIAGNALRTKISVKKKPVLNGGENVFLKQMDFREDEACIVLRRKDRMPVYVTDGTEKILRITRFR